MDALRPFCAGNTQARRAERESSIRNPKSKIPKVLLVTGKLAEPSLRRVAGELAATGKVEPCVHVLNIQVAALMTAEWVGRKLELAADEKVDRVILPGHCRGDLAPLARKLGVPVETGPYDLHDLPEMFGRQRADQTPHAYTIEILAEINHAARLSMQEIIAMAEAYRADGADVIDIGCDPTAPGSKRTAWRGVAEAVRELRARGMRVSVDSFHSEEVRLAIEAGAELVLSVNSKNCQSVSGPGGAEVVAIPDTPQDLRSLARTIEKLEKRGVRYRIDPIVEPIGLGFAHSLGRYLQVRKQFPKAALMMGVGNLTEMTEADSAGVNMLLMGFCEEVGVGSVLTTQVINWARSSVREIDLARRIMRHAVAHRTPPKHVDSRLVMLRDPKLRTRPPEELEQLARSLTDRNVRLFVQDGRLHMMNKDFHLVGDDPFELFAQMPAGSVDASHAFYLGYEMAKAVTARTLGKNYTQDRALRWGMLTQEEVSHQDKKAAKRREQAEEPKA